MNYAIQAAYISLQQELARSIAERDELLAALKKSVSALESCQTGDTSTGHVIYPSFDEDLCSEAWEDAQAAIGKATGANR